jgi:L-amino acid N-acyltransferase YncA
MPQSNSNIELRSAEVGDAAAVAAIYNHYVSNSTITFEEAAVSAEEMARRIGEVLAKNLPWCVAIAREKTQEAAQETVVGFAYATPWRARSAYRYAVEVTVYVAQGHLRQGIGSRLYAALLDTLAKRDLHTAIAGIALPNDESVALHERLGFEKVAHFRQVGFKRNRWVDVGYWQRILNARDVEK